MDFGCIFFRAAWSSESCFFSCLSASSVLSNVGVPGFAYACEYPQGCKMIIRRCMLSQTAYPHHTRTQTHTHTHTPIHPHTHMALSLPQNVPISHWPSLITLW